MAVMLETNTIKFATVAGILHNIDKLKKKELRRRREKALVQVKKMTSQIINSWHRVRSKGNKKKAIKKKADEV